MSDILPVYMSFVTSLLSIRVPGVNVSVGSLWLGALVLFFGAHIIRWIFGVNFEQAAPLIKDKVTLKSVKNLTSEKKSSGGVASRASNKIFRSRFTRLRRNFSHRSSGFDI